MLHHDRSKLTRRETAYADDVWAALLEKKDNTGRWILMIVAAAMVATWYWADNAALDEIVRGSGKVIPASREQVIQSLEGGILSQLHVKEGEVVQEGQVLLNIDDTISMAAMKEEAQRLYSLQASKSRLLAEVNKTKLEFEPELMEVAPNVVRREKELYDSRRAQLRSSVSSFRKQLSLVRQELRMNQSLFNEGAGSKMDVIRSRREESRVLSEINDAENEFISKANRELTEISSELAAMQEKHIAREDQVRRTTVRAPMRGVINNILVSTVGGIIQSGEEIMTIVPVEDSLLVEGKVKPSDIGFLRPGLPVTVKITAYDFSIYGGLEGELTHVSADTFQDERNPEVVYYKAFVRTKTSQLLNKKGKEMPIIPGMVAEVDILTGKKTVLDYLLKPILKARQNAMTER